MLAEIITIGDEILIGQIVDTNSAFMSTELNKAGIQVYQITSIQDDKNHILEALTSASSRVDLVLITGGLGPTKDDITKQTLCEYFNDTLVENTIVLDNIKHIFKNYVDREPLPANLMQAMVPSTATILNNIHGTAPGMWFDTNNTVYVSMPGVPYEMKALLTNEVLPRVIKRFKTPFIYHKTLLTYGMGESEIQERIKDWEEALPKSIKLAYLPSLGRVRLRLSSTGKNQDILEKNVDEQMSVLEKMLQDISVGYENETTIVERIGKILAKSKQTLCIAESCTGGAIAQEITSRPGASQFLKGTIVPYETLQKINILKINPEIIEKHTVVSAPVAQAMALQSKKLFGSDYAIATTGIAGPTKGDAVDEVGTVHIAVATPEHVFSQKFMFGKPRERVIKKATNKSFELLLKEILKN